MDMSNSNLAVRVSALFDSFLLAVKNIGFWETLDYSAKRILCAIFDTSHIRLRSKTSRYPLFCRIKSSDKDVFGQIFIGREYRCLDDVTHAPLIIDCGANCGYSAAYFLTRFPDAALIAVEPDSGNFVELERNTAQFGNRVRLVKAGVWSKDAPLVLDYLDGGDGRDWARSVREAKAGEAPDIVAVSIDSLLKESGFSRIGILKIDIEGSELELFRNGPPPWVSAVDNLVIEIHGKVCHRAVMSALETQPFDISQCEELTVFRRRI